MRSARRFFFAGLTAAVLPVSAWAQIQYDKIELIPEEIAANLTMLAGNKDVDPGHPDGAGGRIGVLHGPDGVLIVDDLLATGGTAKAVVDLVEGVGGKVEGLLFVDRFGDF